MGGAADYQVCPQCREEYTLAVLRCAECDVALVSPGAVPEDEPVAEMPPARDLSCVRVAPLAWIRALSGGLEQLGIEHRVEAATASDCPEGQTAEGFGDADLFGLYVRAASLAPARALDLEIQGQVMPEEAPDLEEGQEDACPACGTALAPEATECADCGLPFL